MNEAEDQAYREAIAQRMLDSSDSFAELHRQLAAKWDMRTADIIVQLALLAIAIDLEQRGYSLGTKKEPPNPS